MIVLHEARAYDGRNIEMCSTGKSDAEGNPMQLPESGELLLYLIPDPLAPTSRSFVAA